MYELNHHRSVAKYFGAIGNKSHILEGRKYFATIPVQSVYRVLTFNDQGDAKFRAWSCEDETACRLHHAFILVTRGRWSWSPVPCVNTKNIYCMEQKYIGIVLACCQVEAGLSWQSHFECS